MATIPVGRQYTSNVCGEAIKTECCEQCGYEFVYLISRMGTGKGVSVLFLDDEGAQEEAAATATQDLTEKLKSDSDLVPCPRCGILQRKMVKDEAARRNKLLRDFGWTMTIAGSPFVLFGLYELSGYKNPLTAPGEVLCIVLALSSFMLVGVVSLIIYYLLRMSYNPNAKPAVLDRMKKANAWRTMGLNEYRKMNTAVPLPK